jgi:type IV pilus assembly protein PilQ
MRARTAARLAAFPLLTLACAASTWSTHLSARGQSPAPQTAAAQPAPGAGGESAAPQSASAQSAPAPAPSQGDSAQGAAPATAQTPAATRLTGVQVGSTADGMTVTLRGNGRLAYSAISEADRPPARLVIDFQGVRPDVPASTAGQGIVRRVRVALNNVEPLVTRVVLDLERMVSHRMRPSADGREVVITLEGSAPVETTAGSRPAPVEAIPQAQPGEKVATRLSAIVLGQAPEGVTVTLKGNGRLVPRPIEQAKDAPPRLVLDLPGVRPAVPAITRVNQGAVDRVRVALSSPKPVVTRVVLQMKKQFLYRMRVGQTDPSEVTITIADPATVTEPSAEFVLADPVGGEKPVAIAKPSSSGRAPQQAQGPEPMDRRSAPVTGTGNRRFDGPPVSLDFQGVDLRAVLRTFSEITGLNVVIDPGVKGTVDVSLREVPWDQALDIILRANQLGYTIEGSIVRIAPLDVLAKEEQTRRALKEEQDLSGELKTFTKALSYAKASDLAGLLLKSALTKRGSVELDDRTNTLIVKDLQPGLDQARGLIEILDTAQPQVEIEARIIETQASFSKELGIRLGFNGTISPALGNTLPLTFPNHGDLGAVTGTVQPTQPNLVQTTLNAINGAFSINAALSALETEGKVKVISAPRVIMQNNVEGEILQGTQIPYTTATSIPSGDGILTTFQVPTVQFKDAALKLTVKPRITASGTVIMEVSLERSAPNYVNALPGNPNPAIDTQKTRTTIQVTDGSTALIGGVMFESNNSNDDRTPGLHKLPIIGRVFNRTRKLSETRELVLLITPKIVKG